MIPRAVFPTALPRLAVFLLALWGLSGCFDPTQIDEIKPLGFEPQYGDELPDRLTKVTIRNGRGEVIVDQKPDPYKSTTVRPPEGTFDGTLVIEWKTQDGHAGSQTLEHDPDRSFELDFDWGDKEFTLTEKPRPPLGNRFSFSPFGGYLERALGGTGAFTDITGGENALVEVDKMDGYRIGADFSYRLRGATRVGLPGLGFNADALDLNLGIEYINLEGDDARFVEPGTDATGITFPYRVGLSEGLDFGLTGAESRIRSRFEGVEVNVGDTKVWVEGEDGEPGHWEYRLSPGLFSGYGRYSTDATIQNLTFPDIFAEDQTDLNLWRFGLQIGGRMQYSTGFHDPDRVQYVTPRFAPFVAGNVKLYYQRTDIEGVQQTTAPGVLTPAQQEPLKYSDKAWDFGASFEAELGLQLQFSEYFTAEIKGFTAFDTSEPYADKRDNPLDGGPGIGIDDRWDYGITAGVSIGF